MTGHLPRVRRLRSGTWALVHLRGVDWAGLSARTVRGWVRGSQCLARCGSGHTYGPGCLLGRERAL